jgi:L-asparagine oxygenase
MTTTEAHTEYQLLDGIQNEESFLHVAMKLGDPIALADGNFIKELKVRSKRDAKINTLGSRFGTGMFPFHTDTAFWSPPARLVLLRAVSGDLSRGTYVKPFDDLFEGISGHEIRRSVWICDTGKRKFYSTISFEASHQRGYRFDPNCMRPANALAKQIEEIIKPRCLELNKNRIGWQPNMVAVIPNWTHLHARGASNSSQQERTLQRIYLR